MPARTQMILARRFGVLAPGEPLLVAGRLSAAILGLGGTRAFRPQPGLQKSYLNANRASGPAICTARRAPRTARACRECCVDQPVAHGLRLNGIVLLLAREVNPLVLGPVLLPAASTVVCPDDTQFVASCIHAAYMRHGARRNAAVHGRYADPQPKIEMAGTQPRPQLLLNCRAT